MNVIRKNNKKYGFDSIKDDEAILLLETIIEEGLEPKDALADLKCIDKLMSVSKLTKFIAPVVRTTRSGYIRKNSSLYNQLTENLDSVIQARIDGQFNQ